jgi:two-component system sensor histidine kinase KdpD
MLTPERVMACFNPSDAATDVLQAAARLASEINAIWYAAYVETPGTRGRDNRSDFGDRLRRHIEFAESLGGIVVRVTADRPADGLIAFAHREGVTHAVFGQPRQSHSPWHRHGTALAGFRRSMCGATLITVPLEDR